MQLRLCEIVKAVQQCEDEGCMVEQEAGVGAREGKQDLQGCCHLPGLTTAQMALQPCQRLLSTYPHLHWATLLLLLWSWLWLWWLWLLWGVAQTMKLLNCNALQHC